MTAVRNGFTLAEMLVTLAVFAVLSVLSYGGLRNVLDNAASTDTRIARLTELQTAFLHLGRDFGQAVERPVRNEFGDREPMFSAAFDDDGDDDYVIALTRTGRRNPANLPRSALQRIGYRVRGGDLLRVSWSVLDRAQDSVPVEQLLLAGTDELTFRFLDDAGLWQGVWPSGIQQQGQPAGLPRAVEISIETGDFGRITRLFRIRG